jgi:hypothetical protein
MRHIVCTHSALTISGARVGTWESADAAPYTGGLPMPAVTPSPDSAPALTRAHGRRLRDIYRSAGWPSQDPLEIDLLAAGMLERVRSPLGHETLRVTDRGLQWLATVLARNRAALSSHEALVQRVAQEMARAGRLAWTGLGLRAQVPTGDAAKPLRWCVARPDVFSIRHTSVESYVEPIVHEIKVRRADLLADLRQEAKRGRLPRPSASAGTCWARTPAAVRLPSRTRCRRNAASWSCRRRAGSAWHVRRCGPRVRACPSVSGWRWRKPRRWRAATTTRKACSTPATERG